jgi:hypothetical protein
MSLSTVSYYPLNMKKQKLLSDPVIGLVGGFAALTILVLFLSLIIKNARRMAPGMTRTVGVTKDVTKTPTVLEQWKETTEAALMSTHFALIKTITPNPPLTGRPPSNTLDPFRTGVLIFRMGLSATHMPIPCQLFGQKLSMANGTWYTLGDMGIMVMCTRPHHL